MIVAAAVVPPAPVLLPAYASRTDPAAPVRQAAAEAVRWLLDQRPDAVSVIGDPVSDEDRRRGVTDATGLRVARSLLAGAGFDGTVHAGAAPLVAGAAAGPERVALLVMANGSARRGEKAPGHLDERAFAFDATAEEAFSAGGLASLGGLDAVLGDELLASGIRGLRACAGLRTLPDQVTTVYADDPYGVRWWVVTIACES